MELQVLLASVSLLRKPVIALQPLLTLDSIIPLLGLVYDKPLTKMAIAKSLKEPKGASGFQNSSKLCSQSPWGSLCLSPHDRSPNSPPGAR